MYYSNDFIYHYPAPPPPPCALVPFNMPTRAVYHPYTYAMPYPPYPPPPPYYQPCYLG
jgi:hypothetical protein